MFASIDDVEASLGEDVPEDAAGRVESLLGQARSVIEGYLYPAVVPEPTPSAVRDVSVRMVVRALEAKNSGVETGVSGLMNTSGPATQQRQFSSAASDGGVWMSRQDRLMLRPFRRRHGIASVTYEGVEAHGVHSHAVPGFLDPRLGGW